MMCASVEWFQCSIGFEILEKKKDKDISEGNFALGDRAHPCLSGSNFGGGRARANEPL